jgi:hypothetical protein
MTIISRNSPPEIPHYLACSRSKAGSVKSKTLSTNAGQVQLDALAALTSISANRNAQAADILMKLS